MFWRMFQKPNKHSHLPLLRPVLCPGDGSQINWSVFPPLRLAFAYLFLLCQKDVLDKVDFHTWTVPSPETLCLLQDFQRVPDRKRELDAGSSSHMHGDEKIEFRGELRAGSEQNNSLSTGKSEPIVKQMLLDYKLLLATPAAKTGGSFSFTFLSNCKYQN